MRGLLQQQHAHQAKRAARSRLRAEKYAQAQFELEVALGPRANSLMFERALNAAGASPGVGGDSTGGGGAGGGGAGGGSGGGGRPASDGPGRLKEAWSPGLASIADVDDAKAASRTREMGSGVAGSGTGGGGTQMGFPPRRYRSPSAQGLSSTVISSRLQGFDVPSYMPGWSKTVSPPAARMIAGTPPPSVAHAATVAGGGWGLRGGAMSNRSVIDVGPASIRAIPMAMPHQSRMPAQSSAVPASCR